jgi:hypothetical protein
MGTTLGSNIRLTFYFQRLTHSLQRLPATIVTKNLWTALSMQDYMVLILGRGGTPH